MLPWHQYLMGILLVAAGFNHFRTPKLYERIIPSYIPIHSTMVLVSGLLEMSLGLLLLNKETQTMAAWMIIVMLFVFLVVHIHMLQHKGASLKLPKWFLILRIPLQFVLMYWAYLYT